MIETTPTTQYDFPSLPVIKRAVMQYTGHVANDVNYVYRDGCTAIKANFVLSETLVVYFQIQNLPARVTVQQVVDAMEEVEFTQWPPTMHGK
jgi:hypothetical protein